MDIIIPHNNSSPYRERNLKCVIKYYLENSDNKILVIEQDTETNLSMFKNERLIHNKVKLSAELFHKTWLMNRAIRMSDSEKIMIIDNDCLLEKEVLQNIDQYMGDLDLFTPFNKINFLNEGHTRQLVRSGKFSQSDPDTRMHVNRYTGGVIVLTRDLFEKVGGFDIEIKGWGKEDDAFIIKCKRTNSKLGRIEDGEHILLHLFHPQTGTKAYMKTPRFMLNAEMLAALKRMSEEDFQRYLEDRKSNHEYALTKLTNKYRDMGELQIFALVDCGSGQLKVDTSAYYVKVNEDGKVNLEELLNAAYTDDGVKTLQYTLNLIARTCGNLKTNEKKIVEKYSQLCK